MVLLDTGMVPNMISSRWAEELGLTKEFCRGDLVCGVDGTPFSPPGQVSVSWYFDESTHVPARVFTAPFLIAPQDAPFDFALGELFLKEHGLLVVNRSAPVLHFAKPSAGEPQQLQQTPPTSRESVQAKTAAWLRLTRPRSSRQQRNEQIEARGHEQRRRHGREATRTPVRDRRERRVNAHARASPFKLWPVVENRHHTDGYPPPRGRPRDPDPSNLPRLPDPPPATHALLSPLPSRSVASPLRPSRLPTRRPGSEPLLGAGCAAATAARRDAGRGRGEGAGRVGPIGRAKGGEGG
ncbi:hypothetical protein B0A49_08580 [Cryomyces minteri]|uniref:Peptidase A2 domain-containing protein n=1 Tax=Cryomyces minteri TaxID=331657 RepID=A0A4U0WUY5_9PEZI|nr:hypothetical protein B0A49_08580 [Cryomyces minteri]